MLISTKETGNKPETKKTKPNSSTGGTRKLLKDQSINCNKY